MTLDEDRAGCQDADMDGSGIPLPEAYPECGRCGHGNDSRTQVRNRWVCGHRDPDELGNGMAGGERCLCRGPFHQEASEARGSWWSRPMPWPVAILLWVALGAAIGIVLTR